MVDPDANFRCINNRIDYSSPSNIDGESSQLWELRNLDLVIQLEHKRGFIVEDTNLDFPVLAVCINCHQPHWRTQC